MKSRLSEIEVRVLTDIINGLSEEELQIIERIITERRVKELGKGEKS